MSNINKNTVVTRHIECTIIHTSRISHYTTPEVPCDSYFIMEEETCYLLGKGKRRDSSFTNLDGFLQTLEKSSTATDTDNDIFVNSTNNNFTSFTDMDLLKYINFDFLY